MLNSILVLGTAQGIFLALLLVSKRVDSLANKVLAVAMLAFSAYIFSEVYYGQEYFRAYPRFIGLFQPVVFLFGPLIYLYARIISRGERSFRQIYFLHFLPFVIYTIYLIPLFTDDASFKIDLVERVGRGEGPLYLWIAGNLKFVQGITYVVLIFSLIRTHGIRIKKSFSDIEKINLIWLRNLTIGFAATWAVATLDYVFELLKMEGFNMDSIVPVATSILVYSIGYIGLRQPEIFGGLCSDPSGSGGQNDEIGEVEVALAVTEDASLSDETRESNQYNRSGLSEEDASLYLNQLVGAMEQDRLFKQSDLTLQDLSNTLSIPAHNISEVINTRINKNFYDFVNEYRVKEVQEMLKDPANDNLTFLAVALDAGFNSKSGFNSIFKKTTHLTPSEYRKKERSSA